MPNGTAFPNSIVGTPAAPALGFTLQNAGTVIANATIGAGGSAANHTLYVLLRDENDNEIRNATVAIVSFSANVTVATGITGTLGAAEFHIPFGMYRVNIRLSASGRDFNSWRTVNFTTPNQQFRVRLYLRDRPGDGAPPSGHFARILVLDKNDNPIPNAMVMIRPLVDTGVFPWPQRADRYHPLLAVDPFFQPQFPTWRNSVTLPGPGGATVSVILGTVSAYARTGSDGRVELWGNTTGIIRYGLYVARHGYYPYAGEITVPFEDEGYTIKLGENRSGGPVNLSITCLRPDGRETSPVAAFIRNASGAVVSGPQQFTLGSLGRLDISVGDNGGNGPYTIFFTGAHLGANSRTFTLDNQAGLTPVDLTTAIEGESSGTAQIRVRPMKDNGAVMDAPATSWFTLDPDGRNVVGPVVFTNATTPTQTVSGLANNTRHYVWTSAEGYGVGTDFVFTANDNTVMTAEPVLVVVPTVTEPFYGPTVPYGQTIRAVDVSSLRRVFGAAYTSESVLFFHDYTRKRRIAGPVSPDAYGNLRVPVPSDTGVVHGYIVSIGFTDGPYVVQVA